MYINGIKTKKGGKHEIQHGSVWASNVPLAQKMQNRVHFMPQRQRIKMELNQFGHD